MVRKLDADLLPHESEVLHSPFYPEEVREGDRNISLLVNKGGESNPIEVRIWRYSPFGIEVLDADKVLEGNQALEFTLKLGSQQIKGTGRVVGKVYGDHGKNLIAIKTFRKEQAHPVESNRRSSIRWTCPEMYLPTGTAANPAKYNDYIFFRIDNISAGGIRLVTSMRNRLIAKGQRWDSTISLPMIGSLHATLVVKHIDTLAQGDKQVLVVGSEFVNPDQMLLSSISEYLFNFADGVSLQSLKKDGFPTKFASSNLDFSYVKTEAEYQDVLALRLKAYKSVGKISEDANIYTMGDEFDARARILIVKHNSKIVGSVRAMFHNDSDRTHHEQYLAYPSDFPKKSQCIEASRLCMDPDYRGGDIAHQLLAHLTLTAVKSGRRFMYGSAAGSMIGFWENAGWKKVGVRFSNIGLNGIEHELIMTDTLSTALGNSIRPKYWNKIYAPLIEHLISQELISPTPLELFKIQVMKSFGRLGF